MPNQINTSSNVSSAGRNNSAFNLSRQPTNPGFGNLFQNSQSGFNAGFNQILQQVLALVQQLLDKINKPNPQPQPQPVRSREYRTADGSNNNKANPDWGKAGNALLRMTPKDSSREPGGSTETSLPSARAVSNAVSAQTDNNTVNRKGLSDLFWAWGQFLDHDLTLVNANSGISADVEVPAGDTFFDPQGTGTATLSFTRSNSSLDAQGVAQQPNSLTAYVDGSNVYGSDQTTANALRSFEGGKLRVGAGDLLPATASGGFLAGDGRAAENPVLASMHTIWMREHNRIADDLAAQHPNWSDQTLYQEARKVVVAEIQSITYNEFLPNLLGEGALSKYQGYDPTQNPGVANEFSAAAFRFGHTMLSPTLLRLDENGQTIAAGNLALRDAFMNPQQVVQTGIDPFLRGAASQTAQDFDPMVIDDVRNFLFGQPGAGGLDLVSLNLQRGRDHGLAGYNDVRESLGLSRITSFDDPVWQAGFGQKLAQVYNSPDEVDLWVGGLAEKHVGDSLAGETLTTILTNQFEALRDGDRFWYENQFSGKALREIKNVTLADIIERNSGADVQDNAFIASNIHQAQPQVGATGGAATSRMMLDAAPVAAPTTQTGALDTERLRLLQESLANGNFG